MRSSRHFFQGSHREENTDTVKISKKKAGHGGTSGRQGNNIAVVLGNFLRPEGFVADEWVIRGTQKDCKPASLIRNYTFLYDGIH